MDPRIVLQQRVTFADMNRNKRSITVDMGTREGRELVRRLIPHCDVVVENFSPRVMDRWGLGYKGLRKLREDIIMVRLPGFGLSGPYRDYVGIGRRRHGGDRDVPPLVVSRCGGAGRTSRLGAGLPECGFWRGGTVGGSTTSTTYGRRSGNRNEPDGRHSLCHGHILS